MVYGIGTKLGIDQDFMRQNSGLENDDPNAIFGVLQAIGDISIEARTRNERLNQQLNILAPLNRELTARLQQLESTDREQEIQRLQQII